MRGILFVCPLYEIQACKRLCHTCYQLTLLNGHSVGDSTCGSHFEGSCFQNSQDGWCFQRGIALHLQLRNVHIYNNNMKENSCVPCVPLKAGLTVLMKS